MESPSEACRRAARGPSSFLTALLALASLLGGAVQRLLTPRGDKKRPKVTLKFIPESDSLSAAVI
jgi:hypothetical protein